MAEQQASARRLQRWMNGNLRVQGYRLSLEENEALRVGLRFSTALCLVLVVIGLVAQSAALILALVPIGAVAGWTSRHPFDFLWNHGLRHLVGLWERRRTTAWASS